MKCTFIGGWFDSVASIRRELSVITRSFAARGETASALFKSQVRASGRKMAEEIADERLRGLV